MTKADQTAADRILKAAVREAVRRIREGLPAGDVLTTATAAATLLLDPPADHCRPGREHC